jgi:plastocyanin
VRTRRTLPVALAAGAALLSAAPADAGAGKTKTVKLYDNYFTPLDLKVAKGTTIKWKWPSDPINVHDVKLKKGPSGVKKFQSEPASSGYVFKRTLKVKGTYKIVCTLHEGMTQAIKVTR